MRKQLMLLVVLLLAYTGLSRAEDVKTLVEAPPQETVVIGDNKATTPAVLYPSFKEFRGDDPNCEEYLSTEYDGKESDGVAQNGLSLAPLTLRSKMGSGAGNGPKSEYRSIIDEETQKPLAIEDFQIPPEYRTSAKLLVNWTVRVETAPTAGILINPRLCSSWYGTSIQSFPAGDVKISLFVTEKENGPEVLKGAEGGLTMPPGPPQTIRQVPPPPPNTGDTGGNDPVISGSFLLTPDDFTEKKFPAAIKRIEIKWKNETCMNLVSPAKMRSLTLMLMPTGKEQVK